LPLRPEIRLDRQRRSVRVDGSARHLTPREFDLLAALAAQPGEPIRREVLLRLGADERDRELGEGSRTVDVHVAHVREKLGLPGVIATIRGRGYALNPAFPVEIA
jgi:DNA-binding response OmpR family regulator